MEKGLSETEMVRMRRMGQVKKFAADIVEKCEKEEFTVREFENLVEFLDTKRQLLNMRAADETKVKL